MYRDHKKILKKGNYSNMKKKMFKLKLEIQLDEDAPIDVAINIIAVEHVNAGQSGFSSRRTPSPLESVLALS